jgi:hypothetical protein
VATSSRHHQAGSQCCHPAFAQDCSGEMALTPVAEEAMVLIRHDLIAA